MAKAAAPRTLESPFGGRILRFSKARTALPENTCQIALLRVKWADNRILSPVFELIPQLLLPVAQVRPPNLPGTPDLLSKWPGDHRAAWPGSAASARLGPLTAVPSLDARLPILPSRSLHHFPPTLEGDRSIPVATGLVQAACGWRRSRRPRPCARDNCCRDRPARYAVTMASARNSR